MVCKRCKTNPIMVIPNSNISLCKSCYLKYFQKKVLKTIRLFNLIEKKEKIGVAVSGGKDSLSLLYCMNIIAEKNKKIELVAILIDEGIKEYRDKTKKDAIKLCKELKIPLKIYSFKKEFGYTLEQMIKKTGERACVLCSVLRRHLLNKKSRDLKIAKLATGHNLDDEAQSIIMNQFKNNIQISARLGPITGVKIEKKFIRRIKPLYLLTEKEVEKYADLRNLTTFKKRCIYAQESYRNAVMQMLNTFEKKYPGTKHSVIQSFLGILPLLKKYYKIKEIKYCKKCKEPCSGDVCQVCGLLK